MRNASSWHRNELCVLASPSVLASPFGKAGLSLIRATLGAEPVDSCFWHPPGNGTQSLALALSADA